MTAGSGPTSGSPRMPRAVKSAESLGGTAPGRGAAPPPHAAAIVTATRSGTAASARRMTRGAGGAGS